MAQRGAGGTPGGIGEFLAGVVMAAVGGYLLLWFAIAGRSRRAQELGLRWYNGVDGWDQRSGWQALRALCSGRFTAAEPSARPAAG